jgi:diguanylate cyclase (GGDEF)-like protein
MLAISEPHLRPVLQAIAIEAVATFNSDAAAIALQAESGDFELVSAHGLSERYLRERVIGGAVFRSLCGEPPKEAFLDAEQMRSLGQPELVEAEGIRNLFLIPLLHDGRLIGGLGLFGLRERLRLSVSQRRLAQLFADQAAIAIARGQASQALSERIEDYDLIARVGHALVSRLDPDYDSILGTLAEQLGHTQLALFSLEKGGARLMLRAHGGHPQDAFVQTPPAAHGILADVASHAKMIYVEDLSQHKTYMPGRPGVRSQIVYPIAFGGEVLGVLSAEREKTAAFGARDRRVLSAFADQCAISLSNAAQFATAAARLQSLSDARQQLEQYANYLEKRQSELKLINSVSGAAASTLNLETMLQTVVELVAQGLSAQRCSIAIANEEQTVVEIAAEQRSDGHPPAVGLRLPIDRHSALAEIFTRRRSLVSADMPSDPRFAASRTQLAEQGLRSAIIVPLIIDARVVGTLSVNAAGNDGHLNAEDVAVLETVANQVALGVRNAKLYGRARDRANEDSLTGLANHRHLQERLDNEIARARRAGQPLSIVLFDLNNFKMFNDNYGHQAGDEVLRVIASTLTLCLRSTDVAGRYGGDEFLVILPQADEPGARLLLARVNRKIDEQSRAGFPPAPIEMSAGIAVFPRDGDSKAALIAFADQNMYAQKRDAGQRQKQGSDKG